MSLPYSLNFVVLNLLHLGTGTESWRRDSPTKPTAVTILIRVPAGIVKFSNKTYYNQKIQNIYLKLMHESKMSI